MNARIRDRFMRSLGVLCLFAVACGMDVPAAGQTPQWLQFHDAKTGLSFRYPPDLHPRRREPQKLGLPKAETIVDLVGNTKMNPGTVVLRFIVKRDALSPEARSKRLQELRQVCKKRSFLNVDGHKAVICVSSGSAAVHWSVEILQPRECTIVTLLGGADADQALPPPHDGEFPLLSIIRTVRFASRVP